MTSEQGSTLRFDTFAKGGETGAIISSRDWSKTPLGPIEGWPQSLTTALSICLLSKQPMFVWWKTGETLTIFYNDAYIPIAAAKHPDQIGSDPRSPKGFPEMWPYLEPLVNQVFHEGTATWNENLFLPIYRKEDFLEEAYWSFSYSPVTGEAGQVAGMYCSTIETTRQVLSDRRLRLLMELGTGSTLDGVAEVIEHTAAKLASNREDLPFALLYLVNDDGKSATLAASTHLQEPTAAAPRAIDLFSGAALWPLERSLQTRQVTRVSDLQTRFPGSLPTEPWGEAPNEALIFPLEIAGQERPFGFLIVGLSVRLRYDLEYDNFLKLLIGHIGTNFTNARQIQLERKRAEELAEIDRAKTLFFSNVSHEFRTPLTLMLGPLEENLADPAGASPEHRRRDDLAYRNALRLLKLVNSLLDFSRIEAGRAAAVYEETDIETLTKDLASVFRSAVENAGLHYNVAIQSIAEPVFVDRDFWEKIVLNLLSNAFKFTLQGEVNILLRPAGSKLELEVRDTGTGIPKEELPNLFKRFHRIEGAEGRTHEGSGIGLALVQDLIHLHGGTIEVESDMGEGTAFLVSIPFGSSHLPEDQISRRRKTMNVGNTRRAFVEEAAINSQKASYPNPLPNASSPEPQGHVLLADDNADMRAYIQGILAPLFAVTAVSDGLAALDACAATRFDLILSDVMMPRLDGFRLIERLRALPATSMTPIILLSARAGEEAMTEGLQKGADDYLTKPFSAKELLARVKTQIELGKARLRVERERDRLHDLLFHMPIAICLLTGPEHRFSFTNSLYRQYFLQSESGFGKSVGEMLPNADEQGFVEILDRVYRKGQRFEGKEERFDLGSRTCFFTFVYDPVRDAEGRVVGILAAIHDVTEQVLARKQVEESQRSLTMALEAGKMGTWSLDLATRMVSASAYTCELFGVPSLNADLRTVINQVIHEEDVPAVHAYWEKALTDLLPTSHEYRVRDPEGRTRWHLSRGSVRKDRAGVPVEFAGIVFDITERKNFESQLKAAKDEADKANQLKSAFLANMSHEIRNPLGAMLGFADLLRDTELRPEERLDFVDILIRNGQQLSVIIDDILDLSKVEAGHLNLELSEFQPNHLLADVESLMRVKAQEKHLALRFGADLTAMESIVSDPTRVRQVLLNLVSNAIKFTDAGFVEVTCSARRLEDGRKMLAFFVKDSGIGISQEQQKGLFEIFVQADNSITRRFGGTGLGLSLSKRLAQELKGDVRILSSEPQRGTTFLFELMDQSGRTAAPARGPEATQASNEDRLDGIRVLVVDDTVDNQLLIRRFLSRKGAIVATAADGQTGCEMALTQDYELVLMDIQMPGMDGYTATEHLRERGYRKPIIALSAHAMSDVRKRCQLAGFTDQLTKPIDMNKLFATVKRSASESSHIMGSTNA